MANYDLELNRIIEEIRNNQAKLVCIQLPDGLKQQAAEIEEKIKSETKAQVLIWLGSCYGACSDCKAFGKFRFEIFRAMDRKINFVT
ncbi:hypothetical protein HYU21_03200 [Candidatus Woesearchaeota archaeon]|nr:hypothetical protein [Candidatus Woesearchaeota archaeon]